MNLGFLTLRKNCHNNTGNGARVKGRQDRPIDLGPRVTEEESNFRVIKEKKTWISFVTVSPNPSCWDSGLCFSRGSCYGINKATLWGPRTSKSSRSF